MAGLDVRELCFVVDDDYGGVRLLLGCVEIEVCDEADDFDSFRDCLVEQLDLIATEIRENYTDKA